MTDQDWTPSTYTLKYTLESFVPGCVGGCGRDLREGDLVYRTDYGGEEVCETCARADRELSRMLPDSRILELTLDARGVYHVVEQKNPMARLDDRIAAGLAYLHLGDVREWKQRELDEYRENCEGLPADWGEQWLAAVEWTQAVACWHKPLARYEVCTIHSGTDWAIFLAPEDEEPEWTMSLSEAREVAKEHGSSGLEFLDEVYDVTEHCEEVN